MIALADRSVEVVGTAPRNEETGHGRTREVSLANVWLDIRLGRGVARLRSRYSPPADVRVSLTEVDYEVPRDLDELFALRDGAAETFLVSNAGSGPARSVTFRPRSTLVSEDMAVFEASTLPVAELTAGDCVPVRGQWSSGRCQPPYFVDVRWEDSYGPQVRTQRVTPFE